jgi:hypothetical protein
MRNPHKAKRPAYCTGCGVVFEKTHQLLDHRYTFRCGGEFGTDNRVLFPEGYTFEAQSARYPRREDGTRVRKHKARKPGTVRVSRMHGGSGFRNNWEGSFPGANG